MAATLVDRFLQQEMEHYTRILRVEPGDFTDDPTTCEVQPSSNWSVQIVRFRERSAVVAAPDWKERVTRLVQTAPWQDWLDSPDGLDEVLAALGLEAMDTTERPGGPIHDIGLLCDEPRFRPFGKHADRVSRITPEDPLWNDPDAAPKWPFKYVIVEGGEIAAQAIMKHNLDMFDGKTWAIGPYVRPEHRQKGYGKAVVSAATRQVVEGAGLALWNARADNLASLALCQALGYEKFFWHIRIPKPVEESAGRTA